MKHSKGHKEHLLSEEEQRAYDEMIELKQKKSEEEEDEEFRGWNGEHAYQLGD